MFGRSHQSNLATAWSFTEKSVESWNSHGFSAELELDGSCGLIMINHALTHLFVPIPNDGIIIYKYVNVWLECFASERWRILVVTANFDFKSFGKIVVLNNMNPSTGSVIDLVIVVSVNLSPVGVRISPKACWVLKWYLKLDVLWWKECVLEYYLVLRWKWRPWWSWVHCDRRLWLELFVFWTLLVLPDQDAELALY